MGILLEDKVRRIFQPLKTAFSMYVVGGSTVQLHDADNNIYYPDRSITELMIQPSLSIVDPDKVLANGNKNNDMIQIQWTQVVNGVESPVDENYFEVITAARDGLLKGAIIVKKNVPYLTPYVLKFYAEYYDTRTKTTLKFIDKILLRTSSVASLLLVTQIDKASSEICNPMDATDVLSIIKPTYHLGKDIVSDLTQIGWWWEQVVAGVEEDFNADNSLAFVSTAADGTLTVNKEYVGDLLLRLYSGYFPDGNIPALPPANANVNEVRYIRRFPKNLTFQHYIGGGGQLSAKATQTFGKVIGMDGNGRVVDLSKTHFITWQTKKSAAGTTYQDAAYGQDVVLPVDAANNETDVRIIINELEHRKALADSDGAILVDSDGAILVS